VNATPPTVSVASVHEALRDVIDPEFGFNIVDLGLVCDVGIQGGLVDVQITMATPDGAAQDYVTAAVEGRLLDLPGVSEVLVEVVSSPAWSSRRMSSVAKAHFWNRAVGE